MIKKRTVFFPNGSNHALIDLLKTLERSCSIKPINFILKSKLRFYVKTNNKLFAV